jgi:hypothetical protein
MAVTGTETVRDIVTDALRKIGVVAEGEPPNADQIAAGMRALNRMLKGWQNRGYNLWTVAQMTVALTTAPTVTLDPARPVQVLAARLRRSGIDTPMQELTRQEYDALPLKSATGLPTSWYYNRQREVANFRIWPLLAVANGEEIVITYQREIEDVTDANAEIDVPGEWWDAVVYGLASRLADDYARPADRVTMRAEEELRLALAFDREGSVYFCGDSTCRW